LDLPPAQKQVIVNHDTPNTNMQNHPALIDDSTTTMSVAAMPAMHGGKVNPAAAVAAESADMATKSNLDTLLGKPLDVAAEGDGTENVSIDIDDDFYEPDAVADDADTEEDGDSEEGEDADEDDDGEDDDDEDNDVEILNRNSHHYDDDDEDADLNDKADGKPLPVAEIKANNNKKKRPAPKKTADDASPPAVKKRNLGGGRKKTVTYAPDTKVADAVNKKKKKTPTKAKKSELSEIEEAAAVTTTTATTTATTKSKKPKPSDGAAVVKFIDAALAPIQPDDPRAELKTQYYRNDEGRWFHFTNAEKTNKTSRLTMKDAIELVSGHFVDAELQRRRRSETSPAKSASKLLTEADADGDDDDEAPTVNPPNATSSEWANAITGVLPVTLNGQADWLRVAGSVGKEIAACKTAHADAVKANGALLKQHVEDEAGKALLRGQVDALTRTIVLREQELAEVNKKLAKGDTMQGEVAALKKEFAENKSAFEAREAYLKDENAKGKVACEKKCEALSQQLQQAVADLATHKGIEATNNAKIEELVEAALKAKNSAQAEHAHLQAMITNETNTANALRDTIRQLDMERVNQCKEKDDTIARMSADNAALSTRIEELDVKRDDQLANLSVSNRNLLAKNLVLEQRIAQLLERQKMAAAALCNDTFGVDVAAVAAAVSVGATTETNGKAIEPATATLDFL
jgi:hypothetical protein